MRSRASAYCACETVTPCTRMPCRAACAANPPSRSRSRARACRRAGRANRRCADTLPFARRRANAARRRRNMRLNTSTCRRATNRKSRCRDRSARGCCGGCRPAYSSSAGDAARTRGVPGGRRSPSSRSPAGCGSRAAARELGRVDPAGAVRFRESDVARAQDRTARRQSRTCSVAAGWQCGSPNMLRAFGRHERQVTVVDLPEQRDEQPAESGIAGCEAEDSRRSKVIGRAGRDRRVAPRRTDNGESAAADRPGASCRGTARARATAALANECE